MPEALKIGSLLVQLQLEVNCRKPEGKARVAFDETLKQYRAARSVMRSRPEEYMSPLGIRLLSL